MVICGGKNMANIKERLKYRKKLVCPFCNSHRTRFKQRIGKMYCEKCGHTWDRPSL